MINKSLFLRLGFDSDYIYRLGLDIDWLGLDRQSFHSRLAYQLGNHTDLFLQRISLRSCKIRHPRKSLSLLRWRKRWCC